MRTHALLARLMVAGFLAVAAGCGDGGSGTTGISGGPTIPETVDGTYNATEVTLTEPGGTTDLLGEGVAIALTLTPAGATTGSMTVPADYSESGEDEVVSLLGTYTYDPETGIVILAHAADTFLRETTLHAKGTELTGTFDGGTYTITVKLDSGT